MNKRLFVTLSMAGLAMVAFGARKPVAWHLDVLPF